MSNDIYKFYLLGGKNVNGFSNYIDNKIMPTMGKLSQIKVIKAIQYGAMATMPLTLGVSLIAIIANLPITFWLTWLQESGIAVHTQATLKVTMEIMALYMAFMVGYFNANERVSNPMPAGVLSLATFLILTPQTVFYEGGQTPGLSFDSLGGNGIFGAILIAILVSGIYSFLDKKGLVVKMPDSIPPMVAQSLSPTFIAIIIFTSALFIRIGFGFTQWGDFFTFINSVVGAPIISLGATPLSVIIFQFLVSFFWFFGIHPSTIVSIYLPVIMTATTSNLTAYLAGETMPYFAFAATLTFFSLGGSGNTIGLSLLMPFISKSSRYKTLGKLTFAPGIFNINEPLVFGLPMMLNPIFFIPMIATAVLNGVIGYVGYLFGMFDALNPAVSMPWVTPAFIGPFFTVGVKGLIVAFIAIIVDGLVYLPFFLKADKIALKEEQEQETK